MVDAYQSLFMCFKEFTFAWWSKCKIHIEMNLAPIA